MEYLIYFMLIGCVKILPGNAEVFTMNTTDNNGPKFEYLRVLFPIDRNDKATAQSFHKVLLEDQPEIMLDKCDVENGKIKITLNDYISKVYVVTFDPNLHKSITYKGGVFTDESSFETPHFVASVKSHKTGSSPSYIIVDSVAKSKLVVFAKLILDFRAVLSNHFIMMNQASSVMINTGNEDLDYLVAPFSNCKELVSPQDFIHRYEFNADEIEEMKNVSEFYFNIVNHKKNISIDVGSTKYGHFEVELWKNWLNVRGESLKSFEHCKEYISLSTCDIYNVTYDLNYFDVEELCEFALFGDWDYPCSLRIELVNDDDSVVLETVVPFDYKLQLKPGTTPTPTDQVTKKKHTTKERSSTNIQYKTEALVSGNEGYRSTVANYNVQIFICCLIAIMKNIGVFQGLISFESSGLICN